MPHYTAAVTLLAVIFYFYTGLRVPHARAKYGVKAPAISGQPDFERVFRVQMNTLEWMPIFLPALWLCAVYVGDITAAALGIAWIIGRIFYMLGYTQAAEKRGLGFAIQAIAAGILLVGASVGIASRLISGG
jgi:glutathione S-transferase